MKRLLIGLALISTLTIAALAQGQPLHKEDMTPETRAEKQTEHMSKKLGLDEAQKESVNGLNLDYAMKIKSVRDSEIAQEDKRAQIKELHKAKDESLKEVLTEEQYATHQQLHEERKVKKEAHRAEMKDMTPEQRAEKKTERMTVHLGLTEEQIVQVQELNKNMANNVSELKESGMEGEELRKQIKELRDVQKAELEGVLTKEQLAKLAERKESHKGEMHKGMQPGSDQK